MDLAISQIHAYAGSNTGNAYKKLLRLGTRFLQSHSFQMLLYGYHGLI
jgi:hypothetical protein